jgi:hypothetical protein
MTSGRPPHLGASAFIFLCIAQLWSIALAMPMAQTPPAPVAAGDQAFAGFRAALDGYVALRTRVRDEVPPLRVTPNAQEIAQRSDALARAVARARRNDRSGQFFDTAAASAIRRSLAAALASTDDVGVLGLLNEDMTSFKEVRVHARYPVGYVLPTMPAVLLQALPPLPRQLEYRFIGRALILRDIDAAMIVDYMPDALPAR